MSFTAFMLSSFLDLPTICECIDVYEGYIAVSTVPYQQHPTPTDESANSYT